MNCPCYCEIYSAVPEIPAVIVAIISDYVHTFTDSEFDELKQYGYNEISGDNYGHYNYYFAGERMMCQCYDEWINVEITTYNKIGLFITSVRLDHDVISTRINPHDEHMYEFIQNNFGQDDARCAIWNRLRQNEPMPPWFIVMCDTVMRIVSNWLYSKPRTLVCPCVAALQKISGSKECEAS